MAGHTSEKRWRNNQNIIFGNTGVSELASELCTQMITTLDQSKTAYNELQELYVYTGSSIQGIADQLFYEDWSTRGVPGTDAVLTVDVESSGIITAVDISEAGTGYTDGTNFLVTLTTTAGPYTIQATLSYDVVSGSVTNAAIVVPGEGYTIGVAQTVLEMSPASLIFETEANAEELAKTQDLFDAITALNELYNAASNIAVAQEDRYSQLRRMS